MSLLPPNPKKTTTCTLANPQTGLVMITLMTCTATYHSPKDKKASKKILWPKQSSTHKNTTFMKAISQLAYALAMQIDITR